jgi:hypothetical protein
MNIFSVKQNVARFTGSPVHFWQIPGPQRSTLFIGLQKYRACVSSLSKKTTVWKNQVKIPAGLPNKKPDFL